MRSPAVPASWLRRCLLGTGLLLALTALGWEVFHLATVPEALPAVDFWSYWAAGRLNITGGNPYSPEQVLPLQRSVGLNEDSAIMFWNPPWLLAPSMLFGLLPGHVAKLLWLLMHFVVVVGCADWLWRHYDGPPAQRWLAWVAALTFAPTVLVLMIGQIGPLLLLGVVGFLHFERRGQFFWAGVMASLLAIKPHLFILVSVAMLVWSVHRRRWAVLLGGALVLTMSTAIAWACNPLVLQEYVTALVFTPPAQRPCPVLGYVLRLLIGREHFWIQFLPMFACLAGFFVYWVPRRNRWDWSEQMPLLLPVSLLTAAYGAWPFDAVVLLVLVIGAAVRVAASADASVKRMAVAMYAALSVLALMMTVLRIDEFWFLWLVPAVLACYLAVRQLSRSRVTGQLQGA